MFSQAQLNTFGAALDRKRISQVTFDEAVQENIDEFDMEHGEAIESAIEEFKSQGVDLSGIFTGVGLQSHSIYQLSSQIKESIAQEDHSSLEVSIRSLEEIIFTDEVQSEAVPVLLASKMISCFDTGVEVLQDKDTTLAHFLRVYSKILLLSTDLKEQFRSRNYVEAIPFDHSSVQVKCAALSVAGSLAASHEAGKAVVMSKNPHTCILEVLDIVVAKDMNDVDLAIESTSAVIVSLASADDLTQPSSSAFSNARMLAREGVANSLLDILCLIWQDEDMKETRANAGITCLLCNGIRLLSANDEICKDMVDHGVLDILFIILKHSIGQLSFDNPDVTVSAMSLLRQLLASDHVKNAIQMTEFMDIISSILQLYLDDMYSDSSNRVVEHTFGSVSAMCLRNPDASEALVEHGIAQLIVACMQAMMDRKELNKDSSINKSLRQGCMSIRNIASRSPHVRDVLKGYGTIQVIEHAKDVAKSACTDVGDAAIRDVTA